MTKDSSLFDSGQARQGNPPPPPYPWPPAATTGYPPPGPAVATGYAPGPAVGAAAPTLRAPLLTALAIAVPIVLTLSLLIPEGGGAAITNVVGWSLVALTSGVLVTVGTLLSSPMARQLRIVGAGGVTLFWVLISLPVIGKNTGLGVTLAAVASLWLVWRQERTP